MGRAARCQPLGLVLFRAASRRTGFDGFPIVRLSSDYCVSGMAGCPVWARLWQVAQTTKVLRLRLAMALAHWGCSGPGWPRSTSLRTWWTSTSPGCWQTSQISARSRVARYTHAGHTLGQAMFAETVADDLHAAREAARSALGEGDGTEVGR